MQIFVFLYFFTQIIDLSATIKYNDINKYKEGEKNV